MRAIYRKLGLPILALVSIGYAVNRQSIEVTGPFQVTVNTGVNHWEPATAVGATWVHAWEVVQGSNNYAYTGAWNSGWTSSGPITAPGGANVGDVFLSFDASRNRYVLSATGFEQFSSSAYFATSTDGLNWTTLQTVLPGPSFGGAFDYSSVAVDSTGRIAVGAVLYRDSHDPSQTWGYHVNISPDGGSTWNGPTLVIAPPRPQVANNKADTNRWGINARIVAVANQFYIFLPALESGQIFQPLAVYRYEENGGIWSGPFLILDFSSNPPLNNTPAEHSPNIYYAPLLDASGNSSGIWAVTFQAKVGDYNNVFQCNLSGCYEVNAFPLNQFMNGVSVGPEGGIWVSFVGYSAINSYQLPLYHQTIYFPPEGDALGTTGDYDVDPTSWVYENVSYRCASSCYAMGDYARTASNGYLALDAPYVKLTPDRTSNQLFQVFYSDQPGRRSTNTFTPNTVYFPLGSTLRLPATPNPPETLGIAPEKRRK